MAQHDYTINNQSFPNYRTDHNNSLSAIVSNNSGATEPSTTYAYQWWYDENTDILKMRNADNDAWITMFTFDQTADTYSLATDVELTITENLDLTGNATISGNLSVDGGTIKLDGNYPVATGNVALGNTALNSLTTGDYNVGIGADALTDNTEGFGNVGIGRLALGNNTTANSNTAVGYIALYQNTTGEQNTAVGREALENNTASDNTAVGYQALKDNTSGTANVAVGRLALTNVTSSSFNVAIGEKAGDRITSGNRNICIGNNADTSSATDTDSIQIIADGTPALLVGKGSNTGFINPNAGGVYQGNNSSTWSTTSDRRIKKNIVDNTIGLEKINQIQVRNFEYRTPEEITEVPSHSAIEKKGIHLGVIAQEIEQILPDVVKEETTGVKSVNPDNITWYLVNAIKELSAKVDTLQEEVNTLKGA